MFQTNLRERLLRTLRMVYLTIDDGPSERMNELLEYLTSRGFGAIFFCRGDNMSLRPDLVIRAIRKGFIIGNHSFNHSDFALLTENETREQITKTEKIIEELYERAGVKRYAKYFRFPYGSNGSTKDVRKRNQEILREFGFRSPLYTLDRAWWWDVDVQDWDLDESNVAEKMAIALSRLQALQNEGVLDLHDHEANFRLGLFQEICSKVTSMGFYFHDNCHLSSLTDDKWDSRPLAYLRWIVHNLKKKPSPRQVVNYLSQHIYSHSDDGQ